MKNVGILILAIGVGLCAAYGGRNSDDMYDHIKLAGTVNLLGAATAKAKAEYCEARKTASLSEGECAPPKAAGKTADAASGEAGDASPKKAETPAKPTFESALGANKAAHKAMATTVEQLPDAVAKARATWVTAAAKEVEPKARLAAATLPGPGERFSGWLSVAGLPFLIGLLLIGAGAVVSRKAIKAAMSGDEGQASAGKVDFAVLLMQLRDDTAALSVDAGQIASPSADEREGVKARIETLQLNCIEPLVEARHQLQNRIGLAGFAAVFSPLSAGEWKMNRAWSALVDQHWPETVASLAASSEQLAVAAEKLTEELARSA